MVAKKMTYIEASKMIRFLTTGSALALLMACADGQALVNDETLSVNERFGVEEDEATDLDPGALPPGTSSPESSRSIFRRESEDADSSGLVESVSYDPVADTFTVDNIGFDGANVYARDPDVPTLQGYLVFAAEDEVDDFLTGTPVSQIADYRAILGRSTVMVDGEPRTAFAIVRTGGYIGVGFGGFIYKRNGGVVIPSTGQATYSGDYLGMQVFLGTGGMQYVTGDMFFDIDFEDFNANDALKGRIINRAVQNLDGSAVTGIIGSDDRLVAPIRWTVVEGVNTLTDAGELATDVFSRQVNDGVLQNFFEGQFTGIIAGNTLEGDGGEIVGVVSMTAEMEEGLGVSEAGGAILSR